MEKFMFEAIAIDSNVYITYGKIYHLLKYNDGSYSFITDQGSHLFPAKNNILIWFKFIEGESL